MLLYCDDFQKSTQHYPKGSAGGCYFLPLSLPPEQRRSTSSIRIISLTPPGVSTNEVLHHIVQDLVHATVCGVDGYIPDGVSVKIFTDVVGFIGDYPASAGAVDVIGHVGRSPCTHCTFRRPHASEAEGSRYGYTTTVHAGNPSFLRHAERYLSLRRSGLTDAGATILGMVDNSRADERACPLLHFRNELQARKGFIPLTASGKPVVSGLFDPYRCNVVAPDHLLTGLSQDVPNTVFECLPTNDMRIQVDAYICAALRENGLLPQREAFNMKKKALHSMTLSELYCVVVVAAPTVKIITSSFPRGHVAREASELPGRLQRLIVHTYWWPHRAVDGEDAEASLRSDRDAYFSELKKESTDYVKAADNFCKMFGDHKGHIDKPNLHRLIELYEHTIPAFGHVREFMELVFESAHQPLKRCIANSNTHRSHIFAAEHCVGNDWQGRLASLSREMTHQGPSKQLKARRRIRRLLLGEEADMLDETENKDFIAETDDMLAKLFTGAVQKYFEKDNRISNFAVAKKTLWEGRGKITVEHLCESLGFTTSVLGGIIRTAINWLNAVFPSVSADGRNEKVHSINLCKMAELVKVTNDGRHIGRSNGFDTISHNSVLRAYVPPGTTGDKIISSKPGCNGTTLFVVVVAVLHRKGNMVWAICSKCSVRGDWIKMSEEVKERSFQILCMTLEVRRVAVYHICQEEGRPNSCELEVDRKVVTHSCTPTKGARKYFQTREQGYPPRQA